MQKQHRFNKKSVTISHKASSPRMLRLQTEKETMRASRVVSSKIHDKTVWFVGEENLFKDYKDLLGAHTTQMNTYNNSFHCFTHK